MGKLLRNISAFLIVLCLLCTYGCGQAYSEEPVGSFYSETTSTIEESIEEETSSIVEESTEEETVIESESVVEETEPVVEEETISPELSEEDISQMLEEPEGPIYTDEEVPSERSYTNARGLDLTDDEMYELARIIYLENGIGYPNCTYLSVKYTADVLLNRLQQWGYADVYEVIWAPGQYSTANNYSNIGAYEVGWEISWTALYDALDNPDYTPVFQAQFSQGTPYYTDPITGEKFGY